MVPHLAVIRLYPLKSFDPVEVHEASILKGAGLVHDREFRLTGAGGTVLNAKTLGEKLIGIRSDIDLAFGQVTLRRDGSAAAFRLEQQREEIERWLSAQLEETVSLERNQATGFPDDENALGPTVISTATLRAVASWFPGLSLEETRRRFRTNIEIDGVPAFWEDRLFGGEQEQRRFQIGEVTFWGVNPCARCTVPSRDSRTGQIDPPDFAKRFAEQRRASLPDWANQEPFDHYYRLAVNTRLAESEAGKQLHRMDEVVL